MSASQDHIVAATPMGANLVPGAGGCTFRIWAPRAKTAYVRGSFNGWQIDEASRLVAGPQGHWVGYFPKVGNGAEYKFWIEGETGFGWKRDPYARELSLQPVYPGSNCVVRGPAAYPWNDSGFRPPPFHELVIYQLHIGAFGGPRAGRPATFLDAAVRAPYLAELGVNAIELLPVVEFPHDVSLGYNGVDFFSPEMAYAVPLKELPAYVQQINALFAARGKPQVTTAHLSTQVGQLKALVAVFHAYHLAVLFDVVYNHAGGDFGGDQKASQSLYFLDRYFTGSNNNSLYFTDQNWTGPVFAYWNEGVRQFLIDNATFWLNEAHIDGLRYDEVSAIDRFGGWAFCQDLTDTVRHEKPAAPQIAEFWREDKSWAIRPRSENGAGFDMVWSDGLRDQIRRTISQATGGRDAAVDLDAVRNQLYSPFGPDGAWRMVNCIENHDLIWWGPADHHREPRIAALSDPSNARSWYARSRARVATGLLLAAPGVPMLFMGQEFLEDKYWSDVPDDTAHTLWWDGLPQDRAMRDHLRFTREFLAFRNGEPAFQGGHVNVFHVHNANRVIAFQRWLEGIGRDVVVAVSLNESTHWGYDLGFPGGGWWAEVFNSDVYDNWVNPQVAGNGSGVSADGPPLHGLPSSAAIVLPANGFVVFARR